MPAPGMVEPTHSVWLTPLFPFFLFIGVATSCPHGSSPSQDPKSSHKPCSKNIASLLVVIWHPYTTPKLLHSSWR
ncbi:hypothetical protein L596_008710 [Steinernema carpocapsae]|uniref:Secreted protein n=1 Tax=Steinernema carpocapsae TaxID=34508 RepID=A0A4U5PE45_STECR|nr:hypothetical protein L596_008710 [Steinernema carpocapsae]